MAAEYRPCVGLVVLNRDGLALIGRRRFKGAEPAHAWQLPQGGIDAGETPKAAALRELYEETSIQSVSLLAEAPDWLSYDLPPELLKSAWRGRFRGQTQKWFAFRFEGDDREIDVDRPGGGHHKAEFDAWRWERLERLPDLIIPFKRAVYETVVATFRPLVAGSAI